MDNAKEFHSEALQRGCDAHAIKLEYRPVGQPHYGGIVERVIGTLMQLIHELPGTTFSNIQERGDYNSEKKAALTLTELEHWLTIAITEYYHIKIHANLNTSPFDKYSQGILGDGHQKGRGYPPRIQDRRSFLIDFLPIERRSLQRQGFVLEHITYYSNALSPLIANRKKYNKFVIRRDPRDLSCIYLDPNSNRYLEVPYRTLSRPTITLWEHRQALKLLREKKIQKKDESLIFRTIDKLREVTKKSVTKTKAARRHRVRIQQAERISFKDNPPNNLKEHSQEINKPIKRFEDIELW